MRVRVRFQPGNFTGWVSEGVKGEEGEEGCVSWGGGGGGGGGMAGGSTVSKIAVSRFPLGICLGFYVTLSSALEQSHCVLVACDPK